MNIIDYLIKRTKIIAFIHDSNNFSRTYIDYFEWYYISELKKSNSLISMNDQDKEKPRVLKRQEEIFFCKNAKAIFENGKLTILADSILPIVNDKVLGEGNIYYAEQTKIIKSMINQFQEWEKDEMIIKSEDGYKVLTNIK